MDKKRKTEPILWLTPGVFSGPVEAKEAIGRIREPDHPAEESPQADLRLAREQLTRLEEQVRQLQDALQSQDQRMEKLLEEQRKEREHLYQVVLSLKKEWEMERDAHRHR